MIEYSLINIEKSRQRLLGNDLYSQYPSEWQRHYEHIVDLLMEMHEAEPKGGHDALAFRVAEFSRARSLLDSLKEAKVDPVRGVDAALLDAEKTIRTKLNSMAEQRARMFSQILDTPESARLDQEIRPVAEEYEKIQTTIRQAKLRHVIAPPVTPERKKEFERDFMSQWTAYSPLESMPVTMSDLQRELADENTVLLEYFLSGERSYLWAVTGTTVNSYILPARSDISAVARRVYEILIDGNRWVRDPKVPRQFSDAAGQLSDILLGPVAQQIVGKRLVIVADEALQYIPFDVLPVPKAMNYVPLSVTNEIVNLPSATTLAMLRRESVNRRPAPKETAIFADPVFSADDERVKAPQEDSDSKRRDEGSKKAAENIQLQRAFASTRNFGESLAIPRLPFTRREAQSIYSYSPRLSSKILDFDASHNKVTDDALSQYRVVHFTTHGILNSKYPDLSGIVLSLFDQNGNPINGFLRLNEIYNMHLNAELVVLSGCQTALGKEVKGEGLVGLTRGFMYAGSPRVIASLWKVDDVATAELMRVFYQKMLKEKMRPAAALRMAKIEMIKQKRWKAPYFWAAFGLQGEWR